MNTLFMKRTAGIFQVINLCRAAVTPLSLLKGLIPLAYTSDSLVRRSFYEMETSVEIRTYYKKKPERKKS